MLQQTPYRPPAPEPKSLAGAVAAALLPGRRDILSILPERAYEIFVGSAPYGKRPIVLVNHPNLVRKVLVDEAADYPKSDLMVGALEPLVGDGVFISAGARWAHQRRMIDPAFAHMRIRTAFAQMAAAMKDFEARLDALAASGEPALLDEEMSHLTADIVFRTIFSEPIEGEEARAVFRAFAAYQNAVPQIELRTMLGSRPFERIAPGDDVVRTCRAIRETIGAMIDRRLSSGERMNDIAGDVIAARDPETGAGFDREELIDQIAVFFLAGHETSASALTWALFILSQKRRAYRRLADEARQAIGDAPPTFEQIRRLPFARAVFRETLRLYPPVSFITRVAMKDGLIGKEEAPKGALVVVSPWIIHRHRRFWDAPEVFAPRRFLGANEKRIAPGSYIPFGLGPRVCTGASFATTESVLILASIARRYRIETTNADRVEPVGKLTTRPKEPVRMRFVRR